MIAGPTHRRPGGPVIPPPPPARTAMLRQQRAASRRWLIWLAALALGVALGLVAYQWIPGVDLQFDSWLALLS